eukprot:jgi/Undpi1/12995/HiC_scaffold_7.g02659.m1
MSPYQQVRRQLFSEDSQARPLVFCPFCGEGFFCTGGLTEHLEACFVLERCRGTGTHTEVEAAIKSISAGGGSVPATKNAFEAPEDFDSPGDESFQDTVLQDAPPPASFDMNLRRFRPAGTTNSANGSVGGISSAGVGVDGVGGVGGASCAPEISFAVSEISSGAVGDEEAVMERCAGCGRTFAPGRLSSHAKRLLQAVVNFSQLAESNARTRRGASTQRATPRALIAAIVCRIWQDRTRIGPSVRQQPPRFSNITATEAWHDFWFRAEERKLLCPKKPLRADSSQGGGASQ